MKKELKAEIPKNHQNTIKACRYCPMCRHSCPSEFIRYRESDTPRGRAILLHNVYKGGQEFDASAIQAMYNCFLCGACKSWCEGYDLGGYDIPELIKFARKDIVKQGMAPAIVQQIKGSLLENNNPYHLKKSLSFSSGLKETTSEILYYMGPDINFNNHEIAEAAIKIFERLHLPFTILGDEPSSGKILELLGFENEAVEKAKQLSDRIKKTGCKTLVISDPLAYEAFKKDYEEWGIEMEGIEILHVTEFLARQIQKGNLKLKQTQSKVTLADSEFLGRNNGLYEIPREIIKSSAYGNFVEMQWHHQYMQATGEAAFTFDDAAFSEGKILGEKISRKAESVGARIIVTLSAIAKNNIATGTELQVTDIAEFVADRMNMI